MRQYEKNLGAVSRYRDVLFAFAIIIIIFCHTSMNFGDGLPGRIYAVTKAFGQMGVDIFLFLSGMGLWFSYHNDSSASSFLKKRFARLLPAYVMVTLPWFMLSDIILHGSVSEFLLDFSTLAFWLNGSITEWFIASILLLYLLYPLIYKLFLRKKLYLVVMAVVYLISLIVYTGAFGSILPQHLYIVNETFLVRVPAFMMGTYLAPLIKQNRPLGRRQVALTAALNVVFLFATVANACRGEHFDWYLQRLLYGPLCVTFCVLVSLPMDGVRFRSRFLTFVGSMTLEIYLVHEKVLTMLKVAAVQYLNIRLTNEVVINLIAVILSILLAWIVSVFAKSVSKRLTDRSKSKKPKFTV